MTPDDEAVYFDWWTAHEARRQQLLECVAVDWQKRMATAGYRVASDTRNER